MTEPRYLKVEEVATLLRVSKMTIYRMIDDEELFAIKVRKSFRIPVTAVEKLTGEGS